MSGQYILEGHTPVPCHGLREWATWFESFNRHVALDYYRGIRISTVFLGLDHRFGGVGRPILFESMAFGGVLDQQERRYCTWDEAVEGHAQLLQDVKDTFRWWHFAVLWQKRFSRTCILVWWRVRK